MQAEAINVIRIVTESLCTGSGIRRRSEALCNGMHGLSINLGRKRLSEAEFECEHYHSIVVESLKSQNRHSMFKLIRSP